jgi:hypothetical protein
VHWRGRRSREEGKQRRCRRSCANVDEVHLLFSIDATRIGFHFFFM